jgi:hypothetical protein
MAGDGGAGGMAGDGGAGGMAGDGGAGGMAGDGGAGGMAGDGGAGGVSAPMCDCDPRQAFDVGSHTINMMARFLLTEGQAVETDRCMATWDCDWMMSPPPPRMELP